MSLTPITLPGGASVGILDAVGAQLLRVALQPTIDLVRRNGEPLRPDFAAIVAVLEGLAGQDRPDVSETGRPISDNPPSSDVMTASEAAARVGRSERTVTRWCVSGRLPSARQLCPGGTWLLSLTEATEVAAG